jgi:hypothetical protein
MPIAEQHRRMTASPDIDIALERVVLGSLFEEIRRYLEAVDAFRREGREPRWRIEAFTTEVLT